MKINKDTIYKVSTISIEVERKQIPLSVNVELKSLIIESDIENKMTIINVMSQVWEDYDYRYVDINEIDVSADKETNDVLYKDSINGITVILSPVIKDDSITLISNLKRVGLDNLEEYIDETYHQGDWSLEAMCQDPGDYIPV